MAFTKTTLVVAAAAAAVGLSACGSDSTDTATSSSTSAANSSTSSDSSTSTESSSESSTTEDTGSGETVDLGDAEVGDKVLATDLTTAMMDAMAEAKTGHMAMDMGTIKAEGDFEVTEDGTQNSVMTMEMGGQTIDMISIDGVTYMKGLLDATKWVKIDADTAGAAGAPNVNQFDPQVMAKAFGNTEAEVTAKDGDNTTYALEMNLEEMLKATGTEMPTGATLPETIPVTYVLDGEGRPVSSTINMGVEITVDYSDWGKDVKVEAPPTSEVTTM